MRAPSFQQRSGNAMAEQSSASQPSFPQSADGAETHGAACYADVVGISCRNVACGILKNDLEPAAGGCVCCGRSSSPLQQHLPKRAWVGRPACPDLLPRPETPPFPDETLSVKWLMRVSSARLSWDPSGNWSIGDWLPPVRMELFCDPAVMYVMSRAVLVGGSVPRE